MGAGIKTLIYNPIRGDADDPSVAGRQPLIGSASGSQAQLQQHESWSHVVFPRQLLHLCPRCLLDLLLEDTGQTRLASKVISLQQGLLWQELQCLGAANELAAGRSNVCFQWLPMPIRSPTRFKARKMRRHDGARFARLLLAYLARFFALWLANVSMCCVSLSRGKVTFECYETISK